MAEYIEKQAAIDALDKRFDSIPMEQTTEILLLRKDLGDLPSVQADQTDCRFCHEDSEGYVFPLEKSGHALVRFGMDGWTLSVKYGTWRKNIRINYCPMCGRRLKHE